MILECKDCGDRLPELRTCSLCGVEACGECMLRHLIAAHDDRILRVLSFPVDAGTVAADKADVALHKRMEG